MTPKKQLKTVYVCVCCGYEEPEYHGRCPKCGCEMKPIVRVQRRL